jgi:DNA-binding CsgD family transcriptional regulator
MLTLLADVELRSGHLTAALETLRDIAPAGDFLPQRNTAMLGVRIGLALGDDDLVRRHLAPDLVDPARSGGNTFAGIELACAFAPALARFGRASEARSLLVRAVEDLVAPFGLAVEIATIGMHVPELAKRLSGVVAPNGAPHGRVNAALLALLRGIAARADGNEREAASAAGDAARRFADIGWPLLEGQSLEIAGDWDGALVLYRKIDALGEVRRLERCALDADAPKRGVLTPRERELARLVAAGKDNKAAADALSISKKAVEKYLTSIYAKLGMTSRAQLAVYVATLEAGAREA